MSPDERPLYPAIGTLEAARQAIDYVSHSLAQRRPTAEVVQSANEQTHNVDTDLIVALSNLGASLSMLAAGALKQQGQQASAEDILQTIGRDQEVRAARRALDDLGDGFPFDA